MHPETEQELAHILLIELLAYQFASPVRWIETQDVIFQEFNAERVVEIGPSPTLAGMASRTLKAKYESYDAALSLQRQVLCYSKDTKEIYYTADPAPEEPAAPAASTSAPAPAPAAAAAPVAVAAAAAAAPVAAASAVADEPVKAVDIVRAIVAQKLKKPFDQIPLSKTIKDLVGGKSTLQNEILGDLGKEFGAAPDKAEETPIDELGAAIQASGFNGQLGKQSASLASRLIASKMPGGFNMTIARKYLQDRWGLAAGRQDSVLLLAVTVEPPARLAAEPDAKKYLDEIAQKYATLNGISLASAAAEAGAGAAAGGAIAIDSAAFDALTKDQTTLVRQQMELFAKYLKVDLRAGDKLFIDEQDATSELRKELDLWQAEHGDFYASGIAPTFSPLKARVYDSSWNWARQDALSMFYDIIFGRLSVVDREIVSRCILLMNRSNPTLLEFMQYHIDHCPEDRGETYELAKKLGQMLIDNCRDALEVDPVYKDVMYPTAPETTIDLKGNINYDEVPRTAVRKLEQYVKEMASGGKITENGNRTKLHSDLSRIYKIIRRQQKVSKSSKLQIKNLYDEVIRSLSLETAASNNETSPNGRQSSPKRGKRGSRKKYTETIPFLHLKQKDSQGQGWEYSKSLTGIYLECLEQAAKSGITFKDKYALMTGVGAGSIGAAVLQGLLSGGAKVIVTTSRYSKEVTEYYQAIYAKYGASNSTLIVVPFNQGSKQDVDALVEYIYDSKKGLGWDLDFIVPFAAIPENGREIDNIDSRSELAHRIMLTNLLRILGAVKVQKANRGYETRPAQVVLPMSPNHGTFGSDGLYSESKLALETLFNRWFSESWGSYLTVCGAVIGWTRGTGLMNQNNLIAERIEGLGVRTFSQQEMAFNILGLMSPAIVNLCQIEPVFADLNGGMQYIPNLKDMSSQIRQELMQTSEIRRAVSSENAIEYKLVNGAEAERLHKQVVIQPRANIKFEFPELKPFSDFEPLTKDLHGMVDLEKVCVITGFAEVGPWGNSRTRWEMEAHGQFSLEGCIEMAWIMGLIKHHHGQLKGKMYSGWVDTKTNEPVDDFDVKSKYEKHILEHSGIRLIEPELFNNYDPSKKKMYQEVVIEQDLEPFETSKETALEFKRENGDKVEIFEIPETGQWTVRFLKGASMMLPKALQFDRLVAGQIPTGWNAKTYGISDDIISQVDPITLYVLVSTVEALLSSGITDPYEFYKYVHVSEVGNCTGSGVGGQSALRGMYRDRFLDKPVQKDILQESFVNTMSAWVNMLLLSSSGPIKTPVGACATAIESVDIGYETIMSGKAKICLVGGYDDFQEEGSFEFGNMGATSNSEEEIKHGRTPAEMSRPATTTRAGFMESQGSGIQVMMTAKLAIDMGVPIYGIVGMTATATDKIGRSVPAPGKGILTTARENVESKFPSPLLDIKYRRRQLEKRKAQIREWTESEILQLQEEVEAMRSQYAEFDEKAYLAERIEHLEREASRQEKDALAMWGNEFYKKDARISPIRGALAVWNLSVDDLGVASFHGTSTMANDKNESMTLANMMTHLGRSKGNALLGIFQKYLTGHPKGAAGAWMLNGALQVLNTGLVPGNRNADNIDKNLEQFDSILYPSRSIQTDGIKAASVTSFGFGQKGAQAIVIKSDYLFATLDESVYNAYAAKVTARHKKAYGYIHNAMATNTMFVAKTDPPYNKDQEATVYLDPLVRVEPSKDTYAYPTKPVKKVVDPSKQQTEDVLLKLTQSTAAAGTNVGVDVEAFDAIPLSNETFIERNYTDSEIAYCRASPDPTASFTGTWCAKEAVFKSLGVKSDGAGAALKEIEIVRKAGKPEVVLSGQAKTKADASGVKGVSVSISHNEFQAVAVAVADIA